MNAKIETEELLTIKEAAELLKVTKVTVKRYIAKEIIPSVKIGGLRRIIKGDIWDDFLLKMRKEKQEKSEQETNFFVSEPQADYLVSRELAKEEKKAKLGFNVLTPTEWALMSKNVIVEDDLLNPVWNDLSSPRNKYQLEYGAVIPLNFVNV
jgi:DNA binding domain, excisionase family